VGGHDVIVGAAANVHPSAQLARQVIVGAGAEVAAGAMLSQCVVWPGARAEGRLDRCIVTPEGVIEVDPATIGMTRHER
ncbi:MAG: hypothetical protein KC503_16405, partial [Myxococcales bacterium]|nr:hypothetical protein [Myxococcales bacterium]